jgi:ABC-type uncharacterized transport system permease subunit
MISLRLSDRRREMRDQVVRLTRTGRVMVALWIVAMLVQLVLVLVP